MTQERTEQRDANKDREYMKTVMMMPTWTKTYETMKEQAVIAWPYWMELAEQRREERDSNQRLHIRSLEEIDRLNAENEDLKKKLENRSRAAKNALEAAHAEVSRLNAVIADKNEQIEKQKYFVEKSALAVVENETIEQYKESEIAQKDKEIERLRAVGERIMIDAVKTSYGYGNAWTVYESLANEWRAALKGADK